MRAPARTLLRTLQHACTQQRCSLRILCGTEAPTDQRGGDHGRRAARPALPFPRPPEAAAPPSTNTTRTHSLCPCAGAMNSAQFDGSCGKCVRVRGTEAGASGERDAAGPMPVLCLPAAAASPLIFQCKGGLTVAALFGSPLVPAGKSFLVMIVDGERGVPTLRRVLPFRRSATWPATAAAHALHALAGTSDVFCLVVLTPDTSLHLCCRTCRVPHVQPRRRRLLHCCAGGHHR